MLNEGHGELELEFPHWMPSAKKNMQEVFALKVKGRTVK